MMWHPMCDNEVDGTSERALYTTCRHVWVATSPAYSAIHYKKGSVYHCFDSDTCNARCVRNIDGVPLYA